VLLPEVLISGISIIITRELPKFEEEIFLRIRMVAAEIHLIEAS